MIGCQCQVLSLSSPHPAAVKGGIMGGRGERVLLSGGGQDSLGFMYSFSFLLAEMAKSYSHTLNHSVHVDIWEEPS